MNLSNVGYIYFLRAEGGDDDEQSLVKIGFATHPNKRIYDLRTASPKPLELVDLFRGTRADEAAIHARLSSHRVKGEWFDDDAAMELVEDLCDYRRAIWCLKHAGERHGIDTIWASIDDIPISALFGV